MVDETSENSAKENSLNTVIVNCLLTAQFKFRLLQEAYAIANFLAEACPNPRLAIVGISELLINAVEHGNLGITYEEKTKLQVENQWIPEIERRLSLEENKNKFVSVDFTRLDTELHIRVTDEGQGFDWHKFVQPAEKSSITHGRGIPIAKNVAFSKLQYFGKGNEVLGIIELSKI